MSPDLMNLYSMLIAIQDEEKYRAELLEQIKSLFDESSTSQPNVDYKMLLEMLADYHVNLESYNNLQAEVVRKFNMKFALDSN